MTPEQIGEYLEHNGASDEEIDEFLAHFGVKGMKWGVRREARKDIRQIGKDARKSMKRVEKAKTKEEMQKAVDDYRKNVYDKVRTEKFADAVKATSVMTKGDKAAHILLFGPFAALTIPETKRALQVRRATGVQNEKDLSAKILKDFQSQLKDF